MPPRKKKVVSETDRESAHKSADNAPNAPNTVVVPLTPVQLQQLQIIAQLAHGDTPETYAQKVLSRHIADRLYLVTR